MLFDPKWQKPEVKADPFSLESLATWLETMPAEGRYDACDIDNCLMAQYFRASGFRIIRYGSVSITHLVKGWWIFSRTKKSYYPLGFEAIAIGAQSTFGAALSRARKALAERT